MESDDEPYWLVLKVQAPPEVRLELKDTGTGFWFIFVEPLRYIPATDSAPGFVCLTRPSSSLLSFVY